MAAGIFVPGVVRTDAPMQFDGPVIVNGATTNTGAVTNTGATVFSGSASIGTLNLGIAENQPGPADVGLLGWNYDPLNATTTSLSVAARLYLVAVWFRQSTLVSNLWCNITTGSTTPTVGQNFLGLYNSTGTQVAATADISASTTVGVKTFPVVTPVTLPTGQYWVAFVLNAGTNPTLATAVSASTYGHLSNTASAYRFATNGTNTTLPATITPASNVTTNALTFWTGVS